MQLEYLYKKEEFGQRADLFKWIFVNDKKKKTCDKSTSTIKNLLKTTSYSDFIRPRPNYTMTYYSLCHVAFATSPFQSHCELGLIAFTLNFLSNWMLWISLESNSATKFSTIIFNIFFFKKNWH